MDANEAATSTGPDGAAEGSPEPPGQRLGRLLVALGALAILVYMTWVAFGFSTEPRRTPLVVGVPSTLLAAWLVVREFRGSEPTRAAEEGTTLHAPDAADAPPTAPAEDQLSTLGAAIWIAVLSAMFLLFGFLVTTLLFPPLFMRVYGREPWRTILITTVVVFVATYGFFVALLEIQLYRGIVTIPFVDGLL